MNLSVEVTASIEKLQKNIAEGKRTIKGFEKDTKNSHDNISRSANKATKDFSKFNTKVANGSSTLTAFSRIVQDAPYGLTAIAGNITNTAEQFGYLTQKTGSAGGAVKSMFASLKGIGGITFGISVATSLLVAFGDKLFQATKRSQEFLSAISQASTNAIVKFKTLTDTVLDTAASEREQAQALKLLKKEFSDFDSSLLTNKKNYKAARQAVESYTDSLVEQARAQAALGLIQEKQAKILEVQEKRMLKIRNEYGSATLEQFEKKRQLLLKAAEKQAGDLTRLGEKERGIREAQLAKLKQQINERFDTVLEMGRKEEEALKAQIDRLARLGKVRDQILFGAVVNPRSRGNILETETNKIKEDWLKTSRDLSEYFKENPVKAPKIDDKEFKESLTKFGEYSLQFEAEVNKFIQPSLITAFSDFGNSMGEALASGGSVLGAVGMSLVQSFGRFISQMGGLLIKYGLIAKLKGKLDLATQKGGLFAIGAGTAAIAAGIAMKAAGAAMSRQASSGFGGGGSVNSGGGDSTGSGIFSGGSGGNGSFSSGGGIEDVVFVLRGADLYGSINNYLRRNGNTGGTLSVN